MNERIKQLKQQATDYVDSVDDGLGIEHYRELVDLKFAELIVRDCMDVAKLTEADDGNDYKSGRQWAAVDIKNHFGVEE